MFLQGIFLISHERSIFYREMEDKGVLLAETLAGISRDPIVSYQFSRLKEQIEAIQSKTGITYITIVNENYQILADTREKLEGWSYSGSLVTKTAVLFSENEMIVRAPVFIFDDQKGMVEISFSLHTVNEKIKENALIFALFFFFQLLCALLFGLLFELQLVRPLQNLAVSVADISPDTLLKPMVISRSSSIEIKQVAHSIEKMKETINKAQEEIVARTQLATMGKIAANFAHEIRNPLEAISGAAEILSYSIERNSEEDVYVKMIQEEIRGLNDYLESFLEFSRPQTSCPEPIDINVIIRETTILLRSLFAKRNIQCILDLDDRLPKFLADASQLRRVCINILLNAIEAMNEKDRSAERRIRIISGTEKDKIVIDFFDTGTGISEKSFSKIFDPYFTTKRSGTGLGLAICKNILSQHDGDIDVVETSHLGTHIRISFQIGPGE